MDKQRVEAFSDGVIAIIITIMVLELKSPEGFEFTALLKILPTLLTYLLSFIFIGIYWVNHHHLFKAVECIDGKILWANLHLLFWLSLVPFVMRWLGETQISPFPVAVYGMLLLFAGIAYRILVHLLVSQPECNPTLVKAVGNDRKGKISILIYAVGIVVALYFPLMAFILYALVALLWLIPDSRIERVISELNSGS